MLPPLSQPSLAARASRPPADTCRPGAAHDEGNARTTTVLWFAWIVFVVYGSLVPLDFHPLPLADAWHRLASAPWFRIGVEGRADWIANGVLYFPVGFLSVASLLPPAALRLPRAAAAVAAACLFGVALAIAVEFAQVFFPPRTVSLNDLFAEGLGTLLGALTAWLGLQRLHALIAALRTGGPRLLRLLAPVYAFGYAALALFPYDLLLSSAEWSDKLSGAGVGLVVADSAAANGLALLSARLVLEALACAPIGAWWALRQRPAARTGFLVLHALLLGAALGLAVELAQLAIASGVSQGASIGTRAIGFAAGALIVRFARNSTWASLRLWLRRATLPAALAYVGALTAVHGWWSGPWSSLDEALRRLHDEIRFVPFYYHYYTTEMQALSSAVFVAASFAPIGVWCWAWRVRPLRAAGIAAGVATVVEAGRLMTAGSHPDPTNVLIAAAAAWAATRLLQSASARSAIDSVRPEDAAATSHRSFEWKRWVPLLALATATALWLSSFPVEPMLVGIGLACSAVLIAWRPILVFALVAAALPVLDLAPWSGRGGLDEFDMLLLVGIVVAWVRAPRPASLQRAPQPASLPRAPATTAALSIVLLSVGMATAHALWPGSAWGPDAFSNPLSPYNALRLAKGVLWAVALWLLARRFAAAGKNAARAFGLGMTLGLAGATACIVAERLAFSSLLDFGSDYRVAGPFSAMSLGGAYVECFLAVATPFLLVRLLPPVSSLRLVVGASLLVATSYASMVTYSRGGYLALAIGVIVVCVAASTPAGLKTRRRAAAIALLALMAAVAYPVLQGTFAQSRLQTAAADLRTREQHWSESLRAMDDDVFAQLFGMGLGRYAAVNLLQNPVESRTGGHRLLVQADGATVLRLGIGFAYFFEQVVPVQPGQRYRLQYQARSEAPGASLQASLCQKWILASFDCAPVVSQSASQRPPSAEWRTFTMTFVAPDAGRGRLPRPVRLSLNNSGRASIDVRELSLTGDDGFDVLRNGDFKAGMDRWTFTSDHHLAWHTKSLPLGLYFEQGLLGLLAFAWLLVAGVRAAARAARRGVVEGAALLAALCAFATVGLTDTLLDAPRFLLLWLLLCLLPSTLPVSAAPAARAAR